MTGVEVSAVEVQRQWVIVIPTPCKWLTDNDSRRNENYHAALVREWRAAAYIAARAVKPRIPKDLDLVLVDSLIRYGRKPVREIANLRATLKACVDGAIGPARIGKKGAAPGYGIVTDDSDRHVRYGSYEGEPMELTKAQKMLNPYAGEVVLTITDLGGGS